MFTCICSNSEFNRRTLLLSRRFLITIFTATPIILIVTTRLLALSPITALKILIYSLLLLFFIKLFYLRERLPVFVTVVDEGTINVLLIVNKEYNYIRILSLVLSQSFIDVWISYKCHILPIPVIIFDESLL